MSALASRQSEPRVNAQAKSNGADVRSAPPPAQPQAEQIRRRAHEIFQSRRANGAKGDATSDWLQAERELNGKAPSAALVEARSQARGETLLHSGK